ncbi:unnamed protein product [Thlaspi arvense]|uniref:CCHC-type domain-containing protein n=1 Tax=Thlaspi arvense TaxID=13288 RepID=A0AAU9RHJ3_THLAR|nr:unnamed protein product [Thlaspi arvense]
MESGGGGSGAPTGCYKCGRPGHWSRDCPSNPGNPKSTSNLANSDSNSNSTTFSNYPTSISAPFKTPGGGAPAAKPRKAPRSRPKLTPELLLSNDGIGYILAHFPRAFKYRGRGHEVRVRNLGGSGTKLKSSKYFRE